MEPELEPKQIVSAPQQCETDEASRQTEAETEEGLETNRSRNKNYKKTEAETDKGTKKNRG